MIPDVVARLRQAGQNADGKFGDKPVGAGTDPCPNRVAVRITDVDGLFQPAASGPRLQGTPGATRVTGYTSADQRGRIFLNRDRKGTWTPRHQSIELTVTVTLLAGKLPPDAEIRWTVKDPDDPSNDDFGMSDEWGPYVDPKDYDANQTKTGKNADDNEGKIQKSPRWEQSKGGFSLTVVSDTEARTKIVNKRSKVVCHCPDLPGDNLVVQAEIAPGKVQVVGGPDKTGVMTLWNRIDVEYIEMTTADALPVADIPPHFEMLFAQLDFAATRRTNDRKPFAKNAGEVESGALKEFQPLSKKFGQDGFIVLVSALEAMPVTPNGPVFATFPSVTIQQDPNGDFIDITQPIQGNPSHASARFKWTDATKTARERVFSCSITTTGGRSRIRFLPVEYAPAFKATSGPAQEPVPLGAKLLVGPTRQEIEADASNPLRAPGFGVPTTGATVELFKAGSGGILGVTAVRSSGGAAPLSVIFTATVKQKASGLLLQTCMHELSHAYGLPHECGFWDWHSGQKAACCMTNPDEWVLAATAADHLDDARGPIRMRVTPGTENKSGPDHCGRHLKEARRIRLQDNLALGWRR
jgi:hypothetical protein